MQDNSEPKIQCKKCLDIIYSKHHYDFVWCSCNSVGIDGGKDSTRIVFKDLELVEQDPQKFILKTGDPE